MKKIMLAMATLLAATMTTGCASYKAQTYQGNQAMQAMRVKYAVVLEIREVEIQAPSTGTGASAGATLGGIAAYGGGSRGGIAGAVAGAVVGGVVGAVAENAAQKKTGIEITYRLENGEVMALVQEQDDQNPIAAGDRIRIIEGSFSSRAVKTTAG
jgi:outer membrane lipoprotein SlyB